MRAIARRLFLAAAVAGLVSACGQAGAAGGASAGALGVVGPAKAKVTVVEYASVTCSHCARWNQEVYPAFKAKYLDTGKVRYEFREFLTPPEQVAAAGFLVARCAGSAKYLSVIESLFRTQNTLFSTQDPKAWIFNTAKSAGLSEDAVTRCIRDEKALKALGDRVQAAVDQEKVTGTPTFFINGKKHDGETIAGQAYNGGEMTLAQLDALIQPLLK